MEAIRAIQATAIFGQKRNPVRFAVHFRKLTLQIKAQIFQLAGKLMLRIKAFLWLNPLLRGEPLAQRRKINAFRGIPLFLFAVPTRAMRLGGLFFPVRHMQIRL